MVEQSSSKSPKATGRSGARHSALGRGLGALIPTQVSGQEAGPTTSDPLDVLFPARPRSEASRSRGGSAKDLLAPGGMTAAKRAKKTQRKSVPTIDSETTSAGSRDHGRAEETVPAPKASVGESDAAGHISPRVPADEGAPRRAEESVTRLISAAAEFEGDADARDAERSGEDSSEVPAGRAGAVGAPRRPSSSTPPDEDRGDDARGRRESELFANIIDSDVSRETSEGLLPVPGATYAEIPLAFIVPNTRQPREVFDEDELAELRDSILEVGVLQPIVVRPIDFSLEPSERMAAALEEKPKARFELIMGERRLRASELAELETVPAIIRETEDQDLLRDALLENLHRAQLNPLEEASAYQQLMMDFGATQEELSKKIARSRPQIANTLRLLKLPPSVQKKVAAQVISAGHARALLSLESAADMERLAERIVAEGLSVRTTEELVRLGRTKAVSRPRAKTVKVVSPLGESVVSALQDLYETRVTITEGAKKGKIVIEFAGSEDLERIAQLITERRN